MSLKESNTTCSGIDWNSLLGLLVRLKKSKRYLEYLLVGTGAYLGLRASVLLSLRWSDVLDKDEATITEKKTFVDFGVKTQNPSTHTLRKTFVIFT